MMIYQFDEILIPNRVLIDHLEHPEHDKIAPVAIGDGAWLGQNAVVLSGVTVGRGAVVAANAVVLDDVPPRSVAAGVPARIVRELDRRER